MKSFLAEFKTFILRGNVKTAYFQKFRHDYLPYSINFPAAAGSMMLCKCAYAFYKGVYILE